ncbi:MAG: energy-coupling factor ABC transporter ATP-binding protein [Methanoregula sp.]|nr:energy-coupling factor ABC transporter ATP-binding protein [Methanoregula sp.]
MIEMSGLRYRNIKIGNLKIPPGVTSVIGPNGSGKTTVLRLCSGIAEPEAGCILIDGKTPRETDVGWVNEFPDKNILFSRASDEIASALRFSHRPCGEIDCAVNSIARLMNITHLLDRTMRELSGGEKVLVALAAALVQRPKILVLDEYDSHLDETRCRSIEDLIQTCAVPYVLRCTQQMETAARGDYLMYLDDGAVLLSGSPAHVFASLDQTPFYPMSWRCRI